MDTINTGLSSEEQEYHYISLLTHHALEVPCANRKLKLYIKMGICVKRPN